MERVLVKNPAINKNVSLHLEVYGTLKFNLDNYELYYNNTDHEDCAPLGTIDTDGYALFYTLDTNRMVLFKVVSKKFFGVPVKTTKEK